MNISCRLRLILAISVNEMLPSARATGHRRDSAQSDAALMTLRIRLQTVRK